MRRIALSSLSMLVAITFAGSRALGAPTGGVVRSGSASIDQAGDTTTVTQASNKASIDWQSFSLGKRETVNFEQPSASAVTLNRVVGDEQSVIAGALNANGQVFLINANGVLFTKGSQVNTASLVASTLDISDSDFRAGKYVFKGKSQGSVENQGTLSAKDEGYIALLGKSVTNDGVIVATRGSVALASGEKVTLNFLGTSLFSVTIDQGTLNALVENKQAITADGGRVFLTAKAADALLSAQVNNTGVIQARTLGDLTGTIDIHAYGGSTEIAGTLDASAPNGGNGGFIETSGDQVQIREGANITTLARSGRTGTWLIDPDGFTVAASGGDMTGLTLSTQLAQNNVEIESTQGSGSDGNIHVDDPVLWSANTRLTLTATNDIYINKSITATGTHAGLALNFGGDYHILTRASFSGAVPDAKGKPVANKTPDGTEFADINLLGDNAKLTINSTEYTLIHSVDQLVGLLGSDGSATGNFALASDLDFTSWSEANGTKVGSVIKTLTGTLSGLGHEVMNLTLNGPAGNTPFGFIGTAAAGSTLRDIGVTNANFVARNTAGILLGSGGNGVRVSHAYSTGSVSLMALYNPAGGLIGKVGNDGVITDSFSLASVQGHTATGGLIGEAGNNTVVQRVHATGSVSGTGGSLGGLIGKFGGSAITDCYATGRVTNANEGNAVAVVHAGGLVGEINGSRSGTITLTNSFARGDVLVDWVASAGGLVGSISGSGATLTLRNSHATGDVTASPQLGNPATVGEAGIGGLIGRLQSTDNLIQDSYATGDVTANTKTSASAPGIGVARVGGLIGYTGSYRVASPSGTTETLVAETSLNLKNSYATGKVTATNYEMVGGLLGKGIGTILIDGSYATGDVTGRNHVGGLVGSIGILGWSGTLLPGQTPPDDFDHAVHTIQNSWSAGKVTASQFQVDPEFGGLVGAGSATLVNSYWDSDKNPAYGGSSVPASDSVHGLHTNQILDAPYYIDGTIDQVLAERAARDADTQRRIEEAEARARDAEDELARVQKQLQEAQSALNDAQAKIAQLTAKARIDEEARLALVDETKRQLEEYQAKIRRAQDEADRTQGEAYDAQKQLEQSKRDADDALRTAEEALQRIADGKADSDDLVTEALLAVRDASEAVERAKAAAAAQIEQVRADAQKQIDAARAEAKAATQKSTSDAEDALAKLPPAERARALEAAGIGTTQMAEVTRGVPRRRESSSRTLSRLRPPTLDIRRRTLTD